MKYETKRNIIFIATFVFGSVYLIWRIFFTLPVHDGIGSLVAGFLLILAELVTTLGTFELYYSRMTMKDKEITPMELPKELYPDVDVFIATHNEPVDILYKTVNACTFMEYPDKKKVHIYLCDDGDRAEVAKLAEDFSIGYLGLSGNTHAKSGNYNHALSKTNSPLIATFDADMIPQRTFLMKKVPYFFEQDWIEEDAGGGSGYRRRTEEEKKDIKKIGLVQTPQSFYNPDLFQFNLFLERGIPNEQDFFSREINIMRNASNTVAYTGSNTILLREAMDRIGQFPYHTITEDFETSLRMQKEGYITYATREIQAAGLSTTTVQSMIKQRIRWAQGVIQSVQNTNAIFTKKLPLKSRISYLNVYLYWWSFLARLIFILAPILFALFHIRLVECDFWELLFFWLPSHLMSNIAAGYLSSKVRNLRWSQIVDTILCPYMIIPVFLESVGIHQKKFKVTSKKKESTSTTNLKYMIPHGILVALTIVAAVKFIYGKYGMALVFSSVICFWLLYNLIALLYSLFFMMGRPSLRKYERIGAEEPVTVRVYGREYHGMSRDVSEEGISFYMERYILFPEDKEFQIEIRTEYYKAYLNAELVFMKSIPDGGYQYSAKVVPQNEESKRNWMQIIHDRIHTLPQELDNWLTPYDDVLNNVKSRLRKAFVPKRKAVRKAIGKEMRFSNHLCALVIDTNYRYLSIEPYQPEKWISGEELSLQLDAALELRLKVGWMERETEKKCLLEVMNVDELMEKGIGLDTLTELIMQAGGEKSCSL